MKILVIRFSSLGDIVLTTPCVRLLKENYPDTEIYYAVKKKFAGVLYKNNDLTQTISLAEGESIFSYARQIRALGKFDLVIDLHNNLRSRLLLKIIRKKKLVKYKKPYFKRFFMVYFKKNFFRTQESIAFAYINLLKELGIKPRVVSPIVYTRASNKTNAIFLAFNRQKAKSMMAIAPGSSWFTKTWPLEKFMEVIQELLITTDVFILLLGGKEDEHLGDRLEEKFSNSMNKRIFNQIGKLPLEESAYLLSKSALLLCNDSGLMHIASAFKIKTIVIFLSTIPEFGFAPFGNYPKKIVSKKLECKPCDHKGLKRCPQKHFRCAWEISSQEVIASCLEFLKSHP